MKTNKDRPQRQVNRVNLQLETFEQRMLMAADLVQTLAEEQITPVSASELVGIVLSPLLECHSSFYSTLRYDYPLESPAVAFPLVLGDHQPSAREILLGLGNGGNADTELLTELAKDVASTLPRLQEHLATSIRGCSRTKGASLKFGNYFEADVETVVNTASGEITLRFTNVRMNLGKFAGEFLQGIAGSLQSYTGKLEGPSGRGHTAAHSGKLDEGNLHP